MTPRVRAATLMNFAEVCRQAGENPVAILRAAGLDPRALTLPDIRVEAVRVVEALELAAARSGCETIGLRMAESRRLSDFGALSLLITHQPTLREVLETLARYRTLLNETLAITVETTDRTVVVREDLLISRAGGARQSYELAIGVMVRVFRALLGPRWRPLSVNFTHAAPSDLSVHRRMFGEEVRFGSDFNGVICDEADLDRRNPAADPALAAYARGFVDALPNATRRALADEVRKAVQLLLPTGSATLPRVAESIGASPRTLQRRLERQGVDFRQLVDEVRADLALRFVAEESCSLTRVSQLLGYSQSGAFTRWFKARFGLAPSAWRRRSQTTQADDGEALGETRP